MSTRPLGHSSLHITPLILGTWAIGGWMWGGTDEKKAIAAIQASIAAGITAIDTAPVYGMGYSEEIVGKAVAGNRDKVVLATKCGMCWRPATAEDPWSDIDSSGNRIFIHKTLNPKSIQNECEASLKRLQTDVIDLYQIHWPEDSTPIEDSWTAMVKLKEQGKVRAIGVSNYSLQQLQEAHAIHPVDSIQPPYSLLRRGIEKDLIPFCQKEGISVIAYSSLERGLLTGKIQPNHAFAASDHRAKKSSFEPDNIRKVDAALKKIQPLAEKHNATLAQLILNCTYHRPGITAALVGARDAAQATENAHALALKLSADERQTIVDALSSKELQRPLYDE